MSKRLVQFGSALFASLIASVPLVAGSHGETPTTDQCLAAPKTDTPGGGHWRYRIEHPSNRHCWYQRPDNVSSAQPAAAKPATPAKPEAPDTNMATAMPGSVANAHAELSSRRNGGEQTRAAPNAFPAPLPPTVPAVGNNPSANGSNMLQAAVATRWPGQAAANPPAPANATDDDASDDATPQANSSQPIAANVPVAVADAVAAKPLVPPQTLLFALVGALSVAGLVASAVGFGGRRRNRNRVAKAQADRRVNWDAARPVRPRRPPLSPSMPTELLSPQQAPTPSPPMAPAAQRQATRIPRELYETDEHDDNVAEMLARLARSAQV